MPLLPYGPFEPDLAETNGVSANLLNVVVHTDAMGVSFGPTRDITITGTAASLPDAPLGGTSVIDQAGSYTVYVGTDSDIYRMSATYTWTSIGSGYAVPTGDKWSMIPFGNFLLATNTADGLQEYDVEAGGPIGPVSAYDPRVIFTAFNCVFGGDCLDTLGGTRDTRLLRNSAINQHTVWTPGIGGAGYQPFAEGEAIMGGAELSQDFAVCLQRNAVRGLYRTTDGSIYAQRLIALNSGATNPSCIVAVDGVCYFVDTDGFKAVSASGLLNIGAEKVNRWFLSQVAPNGLPTIEGALDVANERIVWRYRAYNVASEVVFDDAIAYHYKIGQFIPLGIVTSAIFAMASPSLDMDSLDALFPSIDDPSMPDVDSRFYAGGEPRLFGLDATYKPGFFDGGTLEAILETPSTAFERSVLARSVRTIDDSASGTVAIGYRDALYGVKAYSGESSIAASGRSFPRARGKVMSVRRTIPAMTDWTFARGVDDLQFQSGGVR